MRDITIAITAASYSGNKGAAAMLQSSIKQLHDIYGHRLNINLMSVYPSEDKEQVPHDFVKIVSCKPEQLIFVAFPLALLYKIFGFIKPIKKLIQKNKIIKAYANTDVVVDEAGISFVDSRGFVMNTYAFICAAVPMLVGTPVVKYSQAMGTFKSFTNRMLSKMILPKIKLICARGQGTYDNLKGIGIEKNVKLCADGAFTMEDSQYWNEEVNKVVSSDSFYNDNVVGLSISSVVDKKCGKNGIQYKKIMAEFIDYLNESGYNVLMIANAARINSKKPRNNDLMVGDEIYSLVSDSSKVRWYHKEMDAEEIRAYIGKCRVLVASRFHSMIGSLEQKVPVLLVGWSHKYQEVLDMFELGNYAIDFSKLNLEDLKNEFLRFMENENEIRAKIEKNMDNVLASSRKNIEYISEVIDEVVEKKVSKGKKKLIDYNNPDKYIGKHIACKKGYAINDDIRKNAASGGVVTAMLCYMLENNIIDGAWVTKTKIENGELGYETKIATTVEEVRNCSSSIYMDIPLLKHIDIVREFEGRVAVVMLPCQLRALSALMDKDEELNKKIVMKMGLYCSGGHDVKATLLSIEKAGLSLEGAKRFYYRRGHWRGRSAIVYEDGTEKTFSYSKTICAYKNAYYFEKPSCMFCQDQYAYAADISFGDIWLKEMKGNPIKHTSCVIRSQLAYDIYMKMADEGVIAASHISDSDMLRSQKRALAFKYNLAKAKYNYMKKQGKDISLDISDKCKWNHKLAYRLSRKDFEKSSKNYKKVKRLPMKYVYYKMCFIRLLLSF